MHRGTLCGVLMHPVGVDGRPRTHAHCSVTRHKEDIVSKKRSREEALSDVSAQATELRLHKCLHYAFYFPTACFKAWAPFLFLLLTCLRADGVSGCHACLCPVMGVCMDAFDLLISAQKLSGSWWIPLFPLVALCWLVALGGILTQIFVALGDLDSIRCFNNFYDWAQTIFHVRLAAPVLLVAL